MKTVVLICLLAASAWAQQAAAPKSAAEAPALKEARHSLMLVSTRAIALFKSADTIDARLQADGSTIHPATTALRIRIEHTLDQAEACINKGDAAHATEHLKVADELVNRLWRKLGGE